MIGLDCSAGCKYLDDDRLYHPRPAPFFRPRWIIKTAGSTDTPGRRRLVEGICAAYPDAEVIEDLDTAHNKIKVAGSDPVQRLRRGKRTLVLAVHKSAVRHSREKCNGCPNYTHFSPYGFCPYDCAYCYLAGTPGVWFSPTVKVFVNLDEILGEIDRNARRTGRECAFYLGKLQDGLALDPLTGYSRRLVPFFAGHPLARMTVLTKSTAVENLLDLDHRGRTILSWSLNPREISRKFERNVPPVEERIEAIQKCANAGYPIRAIVMPIIPVDGWQAVYRRFVEDLLARVPLQRITLGGICSFPTALRLTELKLTRRNPISLRLDRCSKSSGDGRTRFPQALRAEFYGEMIDAIRQARPELQIGLCLEDRSTFGLLGNEESIGRCNCVL